MTYISERAKKKNKAYATLALTFLGLACGGVVANETYKEYNVKKDLNKIKNYKNLTDYQVEVRGNWRSIARKFVKKDIIKRVGIDRVVDCLARNFNNMDPSKDRLRIPQKVKVPNMTDYEQSDK